MRSVSVLVSIMTRTFDLGFITVIPVIDANCPIHLFWPVIIFIRLQLVMIHNNNDKSDKNRVIFSFFLLVLTLRRLMKMEQFPLSTGKYQMTICKYRFLFIYFLSEKATKRFLTASYCLWRSGFIP